MKKEEQKIKLVFADGKVIELRKPSKLVVDMMLQKGRVNPLDMASVLLKNCMVSGDRTIIGNIRYENEVLRQMDEICGKVTCDVEQVDGGLEVTFTDGKMLSLRAIARDEYGDVLKKMRTSPLGAIERLVKKVKVSGDDVSSEAGYLMGMADVLDDLLQTVSSRLGE